VAAAIKHWLTYDIIDLPVEITRLSFDPYTKPVDRDGTLPIRLFERNLNFGRIKEKGMKWLICIAEKTPRSSPPQMIDPTPDLRRI